MAAARGACLPVEIVRLFLARGRMMKKGRAMPSGTKNPDVVATSRVSDGYTIPRQHQG